MPQIGATNTAELSTDSGHHRKATAAMQRHTKLGAAAQWRARPDVVNPDPPFFKKSVDCGQDWEGGIRVNAFERGSFLCASSTFFFFFYFFFFGGGGSPAVTLLAMAM